MKQLWDRWAPLAGVLSVVCSLVGVLFVLNQPQDKDSDAKIVAYFAQHSHQVRGVVGFFVFFAGIVFLLAFLGSLRERMLAVERDSGRLSALAFGAGIASLPLWGVSMLLANAPGLASGESSSFKLDPNTYRLLSTTSYYAWVAALIVSAVVVWATSALALRTGVLPRWYGLLGIVAGIMQLFGLFLFPFLVWWLWIVVTAVLLVTRRSLAPARAAQPAL